LQQYPLEEMEALRGTAAKSGTNIAIKANVAKDLMIPSGVTRQSEVIVSFPLPSVATTFGLTIGTAAGPTPAPSGKPVTTYMPHTDMPGDDYNITHYPANTDPHTCEAACIADAHCDSWTYVVRGVPAGSGDCCLKKGTVLAFGWEFALEDAIGRLLVPTPAHL
jgi:hypothetical protein